MGCNKKSGHGGSLVSVLVGSCRNQFVFSRDGCEQPVAPFMEGVPPVDAFCETAQTFLACADETVAVVVRKGSA